MVAVISQGSSLPAFPKAPFTVSPGENIPGSPFA